MKIDRIDFGQNNICYHCKKNLTDKAYIVLENGKEIFFGPNCIKKYVSFKENQIPNFIRGSLDNISKSNKKNSSNSICNNNINESLVIEYLRLRCELLVDFKDIDDKEILKMYTQYKNSVLNKEDEDYLNALLIYYNKTESKYSYRNLMACYSAKIAIKIWGKNKKSNFAEGIYSFLTNYYYLSEDQIVIVNNSIKGTKKINGKWFYKKK